MQSLTIFKPVVENEYKDEDLENIKTSRKETINDKEESLEFQLFFSLNKV